jgi:ribosomal protein S18 acetylase RimI-like enzyme
LHKALTLLREVYDDEKPKIVTALEHLKATEVLQKRMGGMRKQTVNGILFILLNMVVITMHSEMKISPLTHDTIPGVKQVIADAWNDVMGLNHTVQDWQSDGYFDPIDKFETEFLLFLTLLDNDIVVGCAAIRRLSDDTSELKRMWLLRPYRRQGWGSKMLMQLLQIAKEHGFRYVRLEVYRPLKQAPAVAFYRKFGFYEIPPYCESLPEALFMEKALI